MADHALSHLKVIDLSHYIAGPFCTKLLAGFGAEVIKVEKPGVGDPSRKAGPFPKDNPDPEKSGLFLYLNTGKKSITLNLKTTSGIEILKKLITKADIVVENFQPRVMPELELGYTSLERINPKLILTSISNFGQTGTYRDYKASEIIDCALGGIMYQTGDMDREPLMIGGSFSQSQAGLHAFLATLAAAYLAEETGIGQQVDISIMEVMNGIDYLGLASWINQGHIFKRRGNVGGAYPWGTYPCKDGYVGLLAIARHWPRFVEWLGMPELHDEKFSTAQNRLDNRDELDALMLPWLIEHDKERLYHEGQSRGIPVAMVRTAKDLLDSPQLKSRNFWTEIDHPAVGKLSYPGSPGILHATPWEASRAPLLGESNEEIYCEYLGLTKEKLARLEKSGVI